MRGSPLGYVDGGGLHLALRELQRHFSDPRVLGGMALIGAILGFAGPFGTFELMPTVPRLVYWEAIVAATYGLGTAIGLTLRPWLRPRLHQPWMRIAVHGLVIGPPITLAVMAINMLAYGPGGWNAIDAVTLLYNCILITMGVSAISEIIGAAVQRPEPIAAAPAGPAILERMPLPQRGKLMSLSVMDHYVEVRTDRGKALVLMRLGDAIRETAPIAGVQIHRSHWVALDAVTRVGRSGGRVTVEVGGESLPVSRGFLPAVRSAGLVV